MAELDIRVISESSFHGGPPIYIQRDLTKFTHVWVQMIVLIVCTIVCEFTRSPLLPANQDLRAIPVLGFTIDRYARITNIKCNFWRSFKEFLGIEHKDRITIIQS